ncbi:hypothetical protein PSPO01_08671 [Paraphaeosphaeria sporulosa]
MTSSGARGNAHLDTLPASLLLEIFSHRTPRASMQTPATSDGREKHNTSHLDTSLRNVRAVDGDFFHVRRNAKNWNVESMVMDGSLYGWDSYRHHGETFHEYLRLRDLDRRLGLSEVWLVDQDEDDDEEEDAVDPLDEEAWKQQLQDEGSNYERATVLCLCPNIEEMLSGSNFNDNRREYPEDEDSVAIRPIVSAGKGEGFGRAHRFEHLRYLSIDVQ